MCTTTKELDGRDGLMMQLTMPSSCRRKDRRAEKTRTRIGNAKSPSTRVEDSHRKASKTFCALATTLSVTANHRMLKTTWRCVAQFYRDVTEENRCNGRQESEKAF